MINFIKNLLGLNKPTETVKEILTPTAPYKVEAPTAVYIKPAKPLNKVAAIGESGAAAVAAATAPKPVNKRRRPHRGNKNAGGTVAKLTEGNTKGNTKGSNNVVKLQQPAKAKPSSPKPPKK